MQPQPPQQQPQQQQQQQQQQQLQQPWPCIISATALILSMQGLHTLCVTLSYTVGQPAGQLMPMGGLRARCTAA